LRALGHGHAGARWLEARGHEEVAPAVGSHPVGRLLEQPYPDWVAATSLEQRLVAYADKRSQQQVVSLDERFARWVRRHPESTDQLAQTRERAGRLELEVCELARLRPDDIRRLVWAEEALRTARARQDRVAS
jgi:hypothetical protein